MKKVLVFILVLFVSVFAYAYEWESIGPSNLQVNNFNTVYYNVPVEILCVSDGVLINEGGNWAEYPYFGLPAWSAVGLDPDNILVFIGDGSFSDGVYKFNLASHQYDVVTYHHFPNFLLFCETNNTYYAGAQQGILESADGLNWTSIDYFKLKNCVDLAYYENHLVVSADGEIHISHNNGTTWNPTQTGAPFICDLAFHDNSTLYGIYPNTSYSSGLWSSTDFGENWNVEFWDINMSSVGIDVDGNIFTGWDEEGIARWDPASLKSTFFNDGLPNPYINKITYNPLVDCVNIVCCTDSGAYLLTDYTFGSQGLIIDHICTDTSLIPMQWIDSVQLNKKLHYAHTSHGGQLTTGVQRIENNDPDYSIAIGYSYLPQEPGAFCIFDGQENDTYISPNEYWETAYGMNLTRDVLNNNPTINASMWSWCCQVNGASEGYIQAYLDSITQLETEFPNVTFIYMTGNAQTTGPAGYNRYLRNQQIRQYCIDNNKVLFDFADLDSWWFNPANYEWEHATYEYNGNDVPMEHPQFNGNQAGHTTYESCEQKGKAVWWMMSELAGWQGNQPFGGYDVDPASLFFGQVYIDSIAVDTIIITNIDTIQVVIDSLISGEPAFSLSLISGNKSPCVAGFTLDVGESRGVCVYFNPDTAQIYSGNLTIYSAQAENFDVYMTGVGINLPGCISVFPTSLEENIPPGETSTQILTISNIGEGNLDYQIDIQNISPQRGDTLIRGYGGPDDFGYSWIDSDQPEGPGFVFMDIESTGDIVILETTGSYPAKDEGLGLIQMPFNVEFYGNFYNELLVSSNGFITFDTEFFADSYNNFAIPSTDDPNDFVSAFWDDLDGSPLNGEIYTEQIDDKFVIQWTHWSFYGGNQDMTFQIVFHENSQTILFSYLNIVDNNNYTIGIENNDGADGLEVVFNNLYVHNGLTIMFSVAPQWLFLNSYSGTILPDSFKDIQVTFDATNLAVGDYEANILINSNDPDVPVVIVPVTLNVVQVTHSILITQGWSGLSSYVIPSDLDVEEIFAPLTDDMIILVDRNDFYWPAQGVNTIGNWDPYRGYSIKMGSTNNFAFTGDQTVGNILPLPFDWFVMPVLSECNVDVEKLFVTCVDDLDIVKEVAGYKVYWPSQGINSLVELFPGRAYNVKMNNSCALTFPECTGKSYTSGSTNNPNFDTPWNQVDYTASAHVVSIKSKVLADLKKCDVIGAFTTNGLCCGMVEIENLNQNIGLSIFANDPTTEETNGFVEGELLQFRLYRQSTNEEFNLTVNYVQSLPNHDGLFTGNGLSAINEMKAASTGLTNLLNDQSVMIFPNPATSAVNIIITGKIPNETHAGLYNLQGQKLVNIDIQQQQTQVDISNLQQGIYLIKGENEQGWFIQKFVKE